MKADPITFAVIKNGLDSVVDEMAYTIIRTAGSEIVRDVMDFSAAICDASGEMVAQAKTIALHLGAIPEAMAAVLTRFDGDLHEGDAVIMNDPYSGGMHLPDIFMFVPVFYEDRIVNYCVAICHHTDVGGRVAGSNASDSTEIYQEGLRLPPIKLFERGRPNEALRDIIRLNVRLPDRVWSDLKAQYAACQVGTRGLHQLLRHYGAAQMKSYMRELLDYAERLARAEIQNWPKGDFAFTDYIDDDGFDDTPIRIQVKISVLEDRLRVDYTGSSPQVKAALNSTKSYTNSCTYLSVRCVLSKDVPNNAGLFRCIEVIAPEASILNPQSPAPCAARALTGDRVFDAMLGALALIVPERVPAAGEGGNTVVCIAGYREDRRPFIIVDMLCGAWGGRPDKDGVEAITNASQNLSNMPVEVMEKQHPVRVEDYGLIPDSGGAGKYRGGIGIRRSYRLLNGEATLQLRADRVRFPPYGLAGGLPGQRSRNFIHDRDGLRLLPGKVTMTIHQGDVIIHEQAGGGGFGPPSEREPARIEHDLRSGKISAAHALQYYGFEEVDRDALLPMK